MLGAALLCIFNSLGKSGEEKGSSGSFSPRASARFLRRASRSGEKELFCGLVAELKRGYLSSNPGA